MIIGFFSRGTYLEHGDTVPPLVARLAKALKGKLPPIMLRYDAKASRTAIGGVMLRVMNK